MLPKILILFVGSPARKLRLSFVASHHLYGSNIWQRCVRNCRPFKLFMLAFACILWSIQTNAQVDSNYVDTVSMQNIDTVAVSEDSGSSGYDDQDDGYVDTTIKHIYDTSQYFFTWKDYSDDIFTKEKITPRHLIDEEVKSLKEADDFWYIPAIEKLETRLKNDPKFRDSLMNARNRRLLDEQQRHEHTERQQREDLHDGDDSFQHWCFTPRGMTPCGRTTANSSSTPPPALRR